MKKLLYCILILITGFAVVSCSDDSWGSEGEPDKQHWYFFGFEQWHKKPNDIKKDVNQGETLVIPMHFWSERPQNGVHAEVEYCQRIGDCHCPRDRWRLQDGLAKL